MNVYGVYLANGVGDAGVDVLAAELEGQAAVYDVERIGARESGDAGERATHEAVRPVVGAFAAAAAREHHAIDVLVGLEAGELHGGVGKYAQHLHAVALVEGGEALLLVDAHKRLEYAVLVVVAAVHLEQDLDAVDWRHDRLGYAARQAAREQRPPVKVLEDATSVFGVFLLLACSHLFNLLWMMMMMMMMMSPGVFDLCVLVGTMITDCCCRWR